VHGRLAAVTAVRCTACITAEITAVADAASVRVHVTNLKKESIIFFLFRSISAKILEVHDGRERTINRSRQQEEAATDKEAIEKAVADFCLDPLHSNLC